MPNIISSFKLFESKDDNIFDDVKDIFQDIADDYDIFKFSDDDDDVPYGISYFITEETSKINIEIYVSDLDGEDKYYDVFKKMSKDLDNFYKRVQQMGLFVSQKGGIYGNWIGPFIITIKKYRNGL